MIEAMPRPRPPPSQPSGHPARQTGVVCQGQEGATDALAGPIWLAGILGRISRGHRRKTAGRVPEQAGHRYAGLLWERYRETIAWTKHMPSTRRQRENIMKHVLAAAGKEPYVSINRKSIVAGRDKRRETPAQARHFLDAMRGMFAWALDAGHVKIDPTAGVKSPAKLQNDGFEAWTEADVEAYCRRWPIGTRQRVWLDVLLYTGLRRGDAVKIGKQHIRDGVATLRTEKSGETITVTLPVLAALQRTLDIGPTGDLAWICGARGEPFVKEAFGNAFSEAARLAGIPKSAHGVRKIAATTAANNGATVAELEAIFGWQGGRMASLYTRAADRVRLAKAAMTKLEGERGNHPRSEQNKKI